MFRVYEGFDGMSGAGGASGRLRYEKPCDSEGFDWVTRGGEWDRSRYPTWEEAVAYANKWLGEQWEMEPEKWRLGVRYYYCGESYVVIGMEK